MKIRVGRLCTLTLISLLSLLAFAAQAGAQGYPFNQLSGSPKLRGKMGNTHQAKVAGATSNYEVLYSFCPEGGFCPDGALPLAGLIQDAAGNLYGTTYNGGANGGGTVFKVDNTGHYTVLYSFGTDGYYPKAGLIQDAAGNLYGTAAFGGTSNSNCVESTCGTVFKLDSTGHETVLYSFCSAANCTDGANPYAGLISDAAGNLYGTTAVGGANVSANGQGFGTVFKLASPAQPGGTWTETVLYSFCSTSGCTDGQTPVAGLIQDGAGNLYGTTQNGGASNASGGGTVFKLLPPAQPGGTWTEIVLYSFCSEPYCMDGLQPVAGLLQDASGNLYGTTTQGGANSDFRYSPGVVFKLDTTGHETVLYSFTGGAEGDPYAGLIQDGAGNLYGTTTGGGFHGQGFGTVFKLASPAQPGGTWTETVLYSFCSASNCSDGYYPLAGLIQDAAGNLYGTTQSGGNSAPPCDNLQGGCGTVFKLASSVTVTPFSIGGTAVSVGPGATAGNTSTITVTPSGGFTGSVVLTAAVTSSPTGAQDLPTLSFGSTSPVSITGSSAGTATLTISTTAATSGVLAYPVRPGIRWYNAGGTVLAFVLLFGIPAPGRGGRTRLGLLVFLMIFMGGLIACGSGGGGGGGGNPGTTPGTYTVTVTGTTGSTMATGTVTLTVQ